VQFLGVNIILDFSNSGDLVQRSRLVNFYALARERLHTCSVDRVWGSGLCTYSDPERFFSYRRDKITGRMANLIWINPNTG